MQTRQIAVAAAVLAVGLAGCGGQPPALGGTTAKVTIDGKDTGNPHVVRCSQTGWAWTIETPNEAKTFSAVIDTGDKLTARSVTFTDFGGFSGTAGSDAGPLDYVGIEAIDFGGFSGTAWAGQIGTAEVSGANGKYVITGSADGNFTDNPSKEVTATFRIEADC